MANYTLNQGETWRVTLELQDANCVPTILATEAGGVYTPSVFFAGIATLTGQTDVPIRFEYQKVETKTYGRGATRSNLTGVFKVYAFIGADDTAVMSKGDWAYEVRQSEVANPADDTINEVATVLEGTITIKDGPLTTNASFVYGTPSNPTT